MERIPDASHLPPGMVMLPSGKEMTLEQFWKLHSADICHFPDAQIAVAIPAWSPTHEVKDAIRNVIGGFVGISVAALFENPKLGGIAAGAASGFVAADISEWVSKKIAHGQHVYIVKVREFMGGMTCHSFR